MSDHTTHRAGFVNIVGLPNVGKSSLINFLIEEPLSIVNAKSQTTRQNIKGFIHGDDFQIVLVDTPGYIDEPSYQLQLNMNSYIGLALEESDLVLLVVDNGKKMDKSHPLLQQIIQSGKKTILVINKAELSKPEVLLDLVDYYKSILDLKDFLIVSVEQGIGKEELVEMIQRELPEHPPFYEKDSWTDRNLRFLSSEIIRERIMTHYQKEIPYSTEVAITKFKEKDDQVVIDATIYVERLSQKKIILGHEGQNLKRISIESREQIEKLIGMKVHLFLFVKVLDKWRNKKNILEKFGYYSSKNEQK